MEAETVKNTKLEADQRAEFFEETARAGALDSFEACVFFSACKHHAAESRVASILQILRGVGGLY